MPSGLYAVLVLPLVILIYEAHGLQFLLYLVVCATAGGFDGIAVGSVYWFLFSVVRFVIDVLDIRRLAWWRGEV